jgi:hypothetical protein
MSIKAIHRANHSSFLLNTDVNLWVWTWQGGFRLAGIVINPRLGQSST